MEYRDAEDNVLDTFDSGEVAETGGRIEIADTRAAPAGTRTVRIRLISVRYRGSNNDGYFDELSFQAVDIDENNYVLRFDGQDDAVNVGIHESLQLQQLTLEAWVIPAALANFSTVIANTSSDEWDNGYGLAHFTTGNNITFFVDDRDRQNVTGSLNGTGPAGLPKTFALHHNYPNPFNPTTTVPFDLAQPGEVTVRVYNVIGRQVLAIEKGMMKAGTHRRPV